MFVFFVFCIKGLYVVVVKLILGLRDVSVVREIDVVLVNLGIIEFSILLFI